MTIAESRGEIDAPAALRSEGAQDQKRVEAELRDREREHGGWLWVEKNEPRGATFIFTLPSESEAAQ